MSEHGPDVVEPLDSAVVMESVFDKCSHDRGGAFGPETESFSLAVGKGVHFLLDDVGCRTDAAGEQFGLLENGSSHLRVTVKSEIVPDRGFDFLPELCCLRQQIVSAAN